MATQKRINGQIILKQATRQSALVGHITGRGEKDAQVLWYRLRVRHQLPSTIRFFWIAQPTPQMFRVPAHLAAPYRCHAWGKLGLPALTPRKRLIGAVPIEPAIWYGSTPRPVAFR
jgi:hypothetical protein